MKASVKVQVCVYVGGRRWGRNRDNMELDFLKPSISTSLEKLSFFFFFKNPKAGNQMDCPVQAGAGITAY